MQKVLFEEKQKFDQPWLWVFIIASCMIPAIPMFMALTGDETLYRDQFIGMAVAMTAMVIALFFLRMSELITYVKSDGIHYRFPPFLSRWQHIDKEHLKTYAIIKYSPLMEYGGWGYRVGFKGKALNVRGNMGIKLNYGKSKSLLIGTQKPDDLHRAMARLMQTNHKL